LTCDLSHIKLSARLIETGWKREKTMDAKVIEGMKAIQSATLAARARTGDDAISTCVKQGLFQVNRVTFPNGASSVVIPLTEYKSLQAIIDALNAL
jgi:hypothetical protein